MWGIFGGNMITNLFSHVSSAPISGLLIVCVTCSGCHTYALSHLCVISVRTNAADGTLLEFFLFGIRYQSQAWENAEWFGLTSQRPVLY